MTDHSELSFLVFGMGAIGTYIGGSLLLAGQKVEFIEHSEERFSVSQSGLRLQLGSSQHQINRFGVSANLEDALKKSSYDLAIVAIKSFDTFELARSLERFKSMMPPVLSLQNGVENEIAFEMAIGQEKVIPGTLTTAVRRIGLGNAVLERLRGMGIAETHALVPVLMQVFSRAGLKPEIYENPGSMKWSKMITNLLANASSAILNMSPMEIFSDPALYKMEVMQIREALAVMEGLNLPVVDLPGTPVRLLAFLMRHLSPGISQPIARRALGAGRGGKMPSFHIDLHQGRKKSEVDYLNGAVVRYGKQLNLATPVNTTLNDVLLKLTEGTLEKEKFDHNPKALLNLIPELAG